jgi:hypothetical protein
MYDPESLQQDYDNEIRPMPWWMIIAYVVSGLSTGVLIGWGLSQCFDLLFNKKSVFKNADRNQFTRLIPSSIGVQHMGASATSWAWDQRQITSTEKFILLCLADRSDDQDCVVIQTEVICEMTGLSETTLRSALKVFAGKKLLTFVDDVMRQVKGVNRITPRYRLELSVAS